MPLWQSMDAERLRQLRLAQDLDSFTLAHRAAISESQLLELEGQSKGHFYTEAIKYQAGQRLLRLLGDLPNSAAPSSPVATPELARVPRPPQTISRPSENPELLRYIGAAFALAGILISAVNVLDSLGLRPGGVLLLVTGLAMLLMVRWARNNWAVIVLCVGCLLVNFSSSLVIRGLNNLSWVAVPIGTMAAGWFLGRRAAWLMAGAGSLNALLIYLLHGRGFVFAVDLPLESILTGWIVSFAVAALIGAVTSQTFLRQYDLIKESRAELNAVVDSSRAMIWSVSTEGFGLRTFNKGFEQQVLAQFGIQPVQGMLPEQIFSSRQMARQWRSFYLEAVEKQGLVQEGVFLGGDRIFEISFNAIRLENQTVGLSVYAQDITERKRSAQQIEFLAYFDPLTGLPNRAAAHQRIAHAVAKSVNQGHRLAVMCLDIDEFKNINDAYGNQVGDAFLKLTAVRIEQITREHGVLFRISSDEFLILLEHPASQEQVSALCDRILAVVRQTADVDSLQITATLCIGVALTEAGAALPAEGLMANADLALREAKKAGPGSCCFFSRNMTQTLQEYLETRDALSRAIQRTEFELYFQPLIDLRTSRVLGAEALIRWRHPDKGMLSPAQFIPVAERSGQIIEIGQWVLSRACHAAASWPDDSQGNRMRVAVNLSPAHFARGQVLADVREALASSQLQADRLELELTEGLLMDSDHSVTSALTQLRAMGVRIAIDDFGTGYSSLAYLQRLSIDKIKLDRQFIHAIDSDPATRTIVHAIVSIAHGLQLEILAEGVESAGVLQLLRQAGCDQAQGYHIATPMPADDFSRWLLSYQPVIDAPVSNA